MRSDEDKRRSGEHIYHVWINERQEKIRKAGGEWEHSLYEFKDLMHLLRYGGNQIAKAFTGNLPTTHRQCSMSAPEPIKSNCLKCCLGTDVTKCDILISIKDKFDEERKKPHYADVPDSEMYRLMAQTCAWHIYKNVTRGQEGSWSVDTSEGHLMDESDRMFWRNVYRSLAGTAEHSDD